MTARKQRIPGAPDPHPWVAPVWEPADASALQALARGDADEHAQRRALSYIVERLCGTYDQAFRPDAHGGHRATDFAEGRRFVGLRIVTLLKLNVSRLTRENNG